MWIRLAFLFLFTGAIFCADLKSSFEFSSKTTVHEPAGKGGQEQFEPQEIKAKINRRLLKKEKNLELYGVQIVGNPFSGISNEEYLYLNEKDKITRIYSRNQNATWTIGLSFISLMQKKLDLVDPKVCKSSYEEDDKQFSSRYLTLCETDPKNSLVKVFDYNTVFEQNVIYANDETGIRHISFEERFNFNGYFFAKISLENRGKLRLLDNAEDAQDLPDCGSLSIEECIQRAIDENGYTIVAKSVEDLIYSYLRLPLEVAAKPSKVNCKLGTSEEINQLNDHTKATGALSFLKLLRRVEKASKEELIDCLNLPEYSANRHALVSIFAINGKMKGLQAIEHFKTKGEDDIYNDLWPTYLTMLSYAPDPEKALVEAILEKFTTSENVDKTFSLSLGSLLRRYCKTVDCSISNKDGQRMFSVFESKLKQCTLDDCLNNIISGISNLRSPYFVPLLKNYLCSKHNFISPIFSYFKTLDSKHWSSPEIRNLMFHIFANRCPVYQSQSWRIQAADLLLTSYGQKNDAKETLRKLYGSLGDKTSAEQEIISYLSAAVRLLAKTDQNLREAFDEIKRERYFNDFLIFLSKAQSSTHRDSLSDFGSVMGGRLDIEFSRGMLKRSLAELALRFENETSILLAFELFSSGVSKVASAFGLSSSEVDDGDINQGLWSGEEVTAGMTLTLFDSQQTPITFFSGEAQLMGAVLSASGDNMVAFNNTFLLNRLNIRWPLLSGFTVELDMGSALSFKLSGSIEISIWYKTSHSIVTQNIVFVTNGVFALKSATDKTLFRSKIDLSAKFGVEFITDVDFNSDPFSLCLQIDHSPHQLKFKNENSALKAGHGIKKDSVQKWTNKVEHKGQGVCVATESKLDKACTDLLGE